MSLAEQTDNTELPDELVIPEEIQRREDRLSVIAKAKAEIEPTLKQLRILAPVLGKAEGLLADTGYFSEANVLAVDKEGLTPYIAIKRDEHNQPPLQRFKPDPLTPGDDASALEWMRWRLQTQEGRAIYSRRKCTIEPTFGIQKEAMGYRRFLVRGLGAVSKEWDLAFNLRRMFSLKQENDEKWLTLVLYWLLASLYCAASHRQRQTRSA